MKFSDFRQYRAKPTDNVFVFVCEDDFLIEESRAVWTGLLEGNWLIEKLHVKEFEEFEIRSIDGRRAYAVPVCTKSIADGDECEKLTRAGSRIWPSPWVSRLL